MRNARMAMFKDNEPAKDTEKDLTVMQNPLSPGDGGFGTNDCQEFPLFPTFPETPVYRPAY